MKLTKLPRDLWLALAALLDATVVRGLLVPAVMALAGRANWWTPRWARPLTHLPDPRSPGRGPRPEVIGKDHVSARTGQCLDGGEAEPVPNRRAR